jgi:hypothetical protein
LVGVGVSLRDSVGDFFVDPFEGASDAPPDGDTCVVGIDGVLLGDLETIIGMPDIKFVCPSEGYSDGDSSNGAFETDAFVELVGVWLGIGETVGSREVPPGLDVYCVDT